MLIPFHPPCRDLLKAMIWEVLQMLERWAQEAPLLLMAAPVDRVDAPGSAYSHPNEDQLASEGDAEFHY